MSLTKLSLAGNNLTIPGHYKFGQALFKLGEINEDEDSVAAHDSLRARNRSGSSAGHSFDCTVLRNNSYNQSST